MNAESLERLFKLTIDGREDLATFVEGLYEYLERVLEVNKFRRVFDDQLKQRDAEKGPSIKNSVRIKIWSAFELLLEFKLACDLVQEDLRLIATIRRAEAQGLRGTKVIRMREALKYLSAPKGTSLYTECRQNLNEVQLRSAVKSVHSYLLLQLLRVGIDVTSTENNLFSVNLKSGTLVVNKNTGDIKLNTFQYTLNPTSREFRVLLKLIDQKDHQATYKELLGEIPTKTNKRSLSFVLKNLKKALGILPTKSAQNKEIIQNMKKHGYRLIT